MHYALTLSTAPSVEPVSLADMKEHLRVDTSADDDYITALISAARSYLEDAMRKQFISATWVLRLGSFPTDGFDVPRPPLQSVTSITYTDTAGDSQTLASTEYQVDTYSAPGRIAVAYESSWPSTRNVLNAVVVTYVAGYGDAATDVPDDIVHAVKLLCAEWYENRENASTAGVPRSIVTAIDSIIKRHRVEISI